MKRRLFNAAALVSLLLCLAVMALWVRSRSIGDTLVLRFHRAGPPQGVLHFVQLWSNGGGLRVASGGERTTDPVHPIFDRPHSSWSWGVYEPGPTPYPIDRSGRGSNIQVAGVQFHRLDYAIPSYDQRIRSVTVPYALLVALMAALPLVWAHRAVQARGRARHGVCARCGYDLRGTLQNASCPECGAMQMGAAPTRPVTRA